MRPLLSLQAWGASSKADARSKAKAISARNIRRNPVMEVSATRDGPYRRNQDGSENDGYSIREGGRWIGDLTLRIDPDGTATIGQITMAGGRKPIGISGVNVIREQIKKDYPQIKQWAGVRTTGARSGKTSQATTIQEPTTRDSQGNVIPLSKRDNPRSNIISNPARKRQQEQIDVATLYYTGKISSAEFERRTDALNKPTVFNRVPEPASYDDIVRALGERKAGTRFKRDLIVEPDEFDLSDYLDLATSEAQYNLMLQGIVSVRLDIPAYEDHDVWVIALHTPSTTLENPAGIAIGYTSAARIRSVRFGMSRRACENIAMGKSKSTIAYMQGVWISQSTEQIFEVAQNVLDDWIQIGMNPARRCYFYQKKTLQPVTSASEVVQVGGMVLAK